MKTSEIHASWRMFFMVTLSQYAFLTLWALSAEPSPILIPVIGWAVIGAALIILFIRLAYIAGTKKGNR